MPVAKLCPPSLIGFGAASFRDLSLVLTAGIGARSTLHLTAHPGYKLQLHPSKNGRLAVRVHLKGVHRVRKRLATGKTEIYYYAWRGGPRIAAEPGTAEFLRLYSEAHATRKLPPPGTLFSLIAEFKASAEFHGKEPSTKRAYLSYLKLIEAEFGDLPIAALSDPEVRGVFKTWRDGMAATPRKADYAWTTLARVLSVAKDRGRIPINPCERGGRLYEAERSDKVWTEADIGRLLSVAGPRIEAALLLALWTGQRQGDLLRLPWSAYDGKHIRLRQSKGGRRLQDTRRRTVTRAARGHAAGEPHHAHQQLRSAMDFGWLPHILGQGLRQRRHYRSDIPRPARLGGDAARHCRMLRS